MQPALKSLQCPTSDAQSREQLPIRKLLVVGVYRLSDILQLSFG
jgi:hypothetical protein